jgi:hypothetical protein
MVAGKFLELLNVASLQGPKRHNAINIFRANATMPTLRARLLPAPKRRSYGEPIRTCWISTAQSCFQGSSGSPSAEIDGEVNGVNGEQHVLAGGYPIRSSGVG